MIADPFHDRTLVKPPFREQGAKARRGIGF